MKRTGLILTALVLVVGLTYIIVSAQSIDGSAPAAPAETAAPTDAATETVAPTEAAAPMDSVIGAFSTVDLQGNAVDSSVFASKKLTLVNVWATFCPPCVGEIPELAKLDQEIDGFQVLGILADAGSKGAIDAKNLELGKKILSDSGAAYTSVLPDDVLNETLMNAVYAVPTSFFVDQNGQKVGDDIMGALDYDGWKAQINEALSQIEAG